MYLVLETHLGCTPEIPDRVFPTWDAAFDFLRQCGEHADQAARDRGEDPWGNGTSGLSVSVSGGYARVWGDAKDPVWVGRVVRLPEA